MNQIIKLNAQNNLFTISCGMSCLTNEVATFDALFSQADKALYDAKAQGKNKIVKGC
jgi:diguanylate cyclase (GGDEF)-like protein